MPSKQGIEMRLLKHLSTVPAVPAFLAFFAALAALAAGWLLAGATGLLIAALCVALAPASILALRGRRAARELDRSEARFRRAEFENRQSEARLRAAEDYFRQSQKMEAVGRLAGGIAHDFNNLLTTINGYTELLLSRMTEGDPNRAMLEEVRTAGEKAASVTRQLLTFSRKQLTSPVTLDLNALVRDLERMLRRLLGGGAEAPVELAVELAADLDPIKADPGHIGEVILNLALNGKDAMPEGGRLTISTANVRLTGEEAGYYLRPVPGDYVCLKFEDTGRGMDAEVREHLFEPFFTTKAGARGAGLGLPAVYGIVDQSRGGIRLPASQEAAASQPGASFLLYFPSARSDWSHRMVGQADRAAHPREETVLVVEDEEHVRHLVGSILRDNGYQVLEAAGAREALYIHEHHDGPIHVLLTDVIMPGRSGREVARELQGLRPGIRTIFMSGYTGDDLFQQGMEQSNALFLGKPFTPAELLGKLAESAETAGEPASAQGARRP